MECRDASWLLLLLLLFGARGQFRGGWRNDDDDEDDDDGVTEVTTIKGVAMRSTVGYPRWWYNS